MDFLDKLTLEDLEGEQRQLAEIVGIEAYKRLVKVYGGSNDVYIAKESTITKKMRDEAINREFNGYNIRNLRTKYGLSEASVRRILAENDYKKKAGHVPGQITIFDKD